MIPAPWSSTKAQWLWSLPVIGLATYAILCMMLSTTTVFPDPYTFPGALATLADFDLQRTMSGSDSTLFFVTIGCVAAYMFVWMFAMRRRASTKSRRIVLWLMIGLCAALPCAYVGAHPDRAFVPFLILPLVLFTTTHGETYQDAVALFGTLGYAWIPPALALFATKFRPKFQPSCQTCGYPTDGLISNTCPECGSNVRESKSQTAV